MAVGGDITEITVNHPTLGGHVFNPKANVDSNHDLGGYASNDDANSITANGTNIAILNRKRWMFEVEVENDNQTNEDLEFAQSLSDSPEDGDWTFTHINGTVYSGNGRPVGDLQANGNSATFTLKVSGGGKLKKQ